MNKADKYLHLQPGTVVNGKYEVLKCLGTGSMGMVYSCKHLELSGLLVAMKVLFSEVARDEVAAARFRNEIVASYNVSNPYVVRAYEYFRDGELVAFTMEYISGGDLADRLNKDELISISEIVRMLSQMCAGVQAIHAAGIIHRDLKPENILLTEQGDIKITDFGIARQGGTPKLTEHGSVVGTLDYVSPEYLEHGQVDTRSDIYALGILAYEMVTGTSPFKGKSVIETMTLRLKSDPEAPLNLRPECPPGLAAIVMKAMARDPAKRYQSAREMQDDLSSLGKIEQSGSSMPVRSELPSSPRISPEIDEGEPSATVTLPADKVSAAKEMLSLSTEETGSGLKSHSALRMGEFSPTWKEERVFESALAPRVSVSDSHVSTRRVKELLDVYQPKTSDFTTFFMWLFVFFVATGIGFYILYHYDPEIFGVFDSEKTVGYTGSG